MTGDRALTQKVALLWPHLDERARRLFAATEARQRGHGGVSWVSRACGVSRVTILKGLRELDEPPLPAGRVRRAGGGRPALVDQDPDLPRRLEALVEPLTRGDPESPLRWTLKSTRALAAALAAQRHPISHEKVAAARSPRTGRSSPSTPRRRRSSATTGMRAASGAPSSHRCG